MSKETQRRVQLTVEWPMKNAFSKFYAKDSHCSLNRKHQQASVVPEELGRVV